MYRRVGVVRVQRNAVAGIDCRIIGVRVTLDLWWRLDSGIDGEVDR